MKSPSSCRLFHVSFALTAVFSLVFLTLPTRAQDFNSALDTSGLTWTNTGWRVTTFTTHDGEDAAAAGVPGPGGCTSVLGTAVNFAEPTLIAFWWRLSSDEPCPTLNFEVNGVVRATTLNAGWVRFEGVLDPGPNTLRWRLAQPSLCAAEAGLDELLLGPPVPPTITAPPADVTVTVGSSAAFSVAAAGTAPLSYQWLKNGAPVVGATTTRLAFAPVTAGDAGGYAAVVSSPYGQATSTLATLTVLNLGILTQPASATRKEGESVTFTVVAGGVPPFDYQWRKNSQPRSGATAASLTLTNLLRADAGNYDVIVGNTSGSLTSAPALLSINAAAPDDFNPAPPWPVSSAVPQTDRQVLVGGDGANLPAGTAALIRVNEHGVLDPAFMPQLYWYPLRCTAVLPDGSLLVAGAFTTPYGWSFARLYEDGSAAPTFQGWIGGQVYSAAPQPDGRVILGGEFQSLSGLPRVRLGRYNADGTLDTGFNPGANGVVFTLAAQPDGQILVGGLFTTLGGQPRNRIGRLSPTGALDASFNPSANEAVVCLLLQPDGKILVGGAFTSLGGQTRNRLARLLPDGNLDAAFNPNLNSTVQTLALQADGKILVGGSFTTAGGAGRARLARLHPDGTPDTSFSADANATVYSVALQEDGKVLVGGEFTTVGGVARQRLARISNPDAPAQSVVFDGATLTWQRGGSAAEVWRTEAEAWNGAGWTNLGPGTHISGGWQWAGLSLPPAATVRLLGHAKGGRFSASTWLVKRVAGPPAFVTQPANVTNDAGTIVTLTALAVSEETIAYRWLKNGQPLSDGAQVSGAGTPALTLAAVFGADGGGYSVLASNALGAVTSRVAAVTVRDPAILTEPDAQSVLAGANATFTVTAAGTPPLLYQWRKDGAALTGATRSSLVVTNVQPSAGGEYSVVVGSVFGSVTSSPAALVLLQPPRITVQPQPGSGVVGGSVTFTVEAAGTAPLAYLWHKDGAPLAGATNPSLTLANLMSGDAGNYSVRVTNLYGTVHSAAASLTILTPYIIQSPASQLTNAGATAVFTVIAGGAEPLRYQWRKAGTPLAGATASRLELPNVQVADAGAYDVWFTNSLGAATSAVAVLTVNAAAPDSFNPGANSDVYVLLPLPDGKVLAGGNFTSLAGAGAGHRIGRLDASGTLDATFTSTASGLVLCMGVQADGRIVVAGDFGSLSGQARLRMGRLFPDGSADPSFVPSLNSPAQCLVIQPDGAIVIGGSFSTVNGETRTNLARLLPDGTLDSNFTTGANGPVYTLALQPDGSLLVAGDFTLLGGQSRSRLGRLNSTGAVDASFSPSANGAVYVLALQPDGAVVAGGAFTVVNGVTRTNLIRLDAQGAVDASFPAQADGPVVALALQADGGIVLGGQFARVNGQPRGRLARINAAGLLDEGFLADVNGVVHSLALHADGRILVGGNFSVMSGLARSAIGRLVNPDPATEAVAFDGATINWWRGGAGPELTATGAEAWNGASWTNLGTGVRVAGGWRWEGLSLSLDATLRLTGRGVGGRFNGSAWVSATGGGRPAITQSPASRTNAAGTTATFAAAVTGAEALSYRWLHNGVFLSDGGGRTGTFTKTLTLASVFGTDAGQYALMASNSLGTATSAVAVLTVLDPGIRTQPASQAIHAGASATFSVDAAGSGNLTYQWRKDGTPISAATTSSLHLLGVTTWHVGGYDVTVTGISGSVTSVVAALTLVPAVAAGTVWTAIPQPDGKALLRGTFDTLGGQARRNFGRLNADGAVDMAFEPNPGNLLSFSCLRSGHVLIGGPFVTIAGKPRRNFARLDRDGVLDESFLADLSGGMLLALVTIPDGRVVLGGGFTSCAGQPRARLARLRADGSLDPDFAPSANDAVYALGWQPDGRLVVGGIFSTLAGQPKPYLGRLLADGSLDAGFAPALNGAVRAVLVQPDGKLLVAGDFTMINGVARSRLVRLQADGALDEAFLGGANGAVNSLALEAGGGIVVGGGFDLLAGQPCQRFGRLTSAGELDRDYHSGASAMVYSVALQGDGTILVGSVSTSVAGQPPNGFARLSPRPAGVQTLTHGTESATWLRSGATPEVSFAQLGVWSGNGWTPIATGTRVAGGWKFDGISLDPAATVRAWGYANAGERSGAFYPVESFSGPPLLLAQPQPTASVAGGVAILQVNAIGGGSLSYQWLRNGTPLVNGPGVWGADAASLVLDGVACAHACAYAVVVTNASGSVTSSVAWLSVNDPVIAVQPRSVTATPGSNVTFTVTAAGSGPFTYQWRQAGVPLPGATSTALTLSNLPAGEVAGHDVVVSGACGSVTSIVAHRNQQLTSSSLGVLGVVPLADGRILAGGNFNPAGGYGRSGLGRLVPDGSLDASFIPAVNALVSCFASQPDGAQVVAGFFANVAGQARNRLARFRPDGSLDQAYDPNANNSVLCLALQPDGKLLVGGEFTTIGGTNRNRLARLNPDGTVDTTFRADADGGVVTIAVQPDGRILVGGRFTAIGGLARGRLARLTADGAVEEAFNPAANAQINALLVQPDGKLLVGGDFASIAGASRAKLARLLPTGAVDVSFYAGAGGSGTTWINSIGLQTDGKILVFGFFTSINGQMRNRMARLHSDGTLDETFNPGANNVVYGFALQPDGRLLVGGDFTYIGGTAQTRLARLDNTDVATSSLTTDGASVTWLRGGTGPEVWRTTFDVWTGGGWTNLGAGTRILGGWQLSGLSLPAEATVRAQGFAIAGDDNSSTYLVEEGFGPPVVSIPPVNRTNFLGTTAGLSAWVVGSGPVHYCWRKGGADLTDGGSVSGAGTPNLLLADVQAADAGWYSVVATNALGSVTSAEVYLAVVPLTVSATGPGLGVATNGQFRMELGGGAAWPVSVETSTNLSQWQAVGTPWVGPEPVVLTQPFSNNVPVRMYRARPVP
jgi:uncharacterized delta-60 repeat protein